MLNTLVNRLLNCLISLFGLIFSPTRLTLKGPSINPIISKRPLKFLTNFYNDNLMQINGTTRRNLKPGLQTNGQIPLSPKQRWSASCNKNNPGELQTSQVWAKTIESKYSNNKEMNHDWHFNSRTY